MCGIAVAIDWEGADPVVRRLIAGMLHRGDITDPLVTVGNNIAMCTRRLRIVDAVRGMQPQASFDDRFLVSLNGEIYNHAELRHELEALGVRFRTECDTEVVANALRIWGSEAIKRLAGMFAFVAVDTETGEFLAARDPFGVKPLYLIQSAKSFLFCSEIRPLLDATEDGDVLLLPPGFMLTRNFCGRYYKAPFSTTSGAASPQDLDRILSEAVRIRHAAGPSGRGAVQRWHRQHSRRPLCAAISPRHAGLYCRWAERARSHVRQALCRRNRLRSARGGHSNRNARKPCR